MPKVRCMVLGPCCLRMDSVTKGCLTAVAEKDSVSHLISLGKSTRANTGKASEKARVYSRTMMDEFTRVVGATTRCMVEAVRSSRMESALSFTIVMGTNLKHLPPLKQLRINPQAHSRQTTAPQVLTTRVKLVVGVVKGICWLEITTRDSRRPLRRALWVSSRLRVSKRRTAQMEVG